MNNQGQIVPIESTLSVILENFLNPRSNLYKPDTLIFTSKF